MIAWIANARTLKELFSEEMSNYPSAIANAAAQQEAWLKKYSPSEKKTDIRIKFNAMMEKAPAHGGQGMVKALLSLFVIDLPAS